jgi:hypothetical protein
MPFIISLFPNGHLRFQEWFMHLFRGELRSAYELAEQLLRRAQGLSDRTLLLRLRKEQRRI